MEAKEETKKKVDTSIQCTPSQSMVTPLKVLEPQSIGTNTGESLLWPGVDMTTTNSDTTPRGMQQASGMVESKSTGAKKSMCSCCRHCRKLVVTFRLFHTFGTCTEVFAMFFLFLDHLI